MEDRVQFDLKTQGPDEPKFRGGQGVVVEAEGKPETGLRGEALYRWRSPLLVIALGCPLRRSCVSGIEHNGASQTIPQSYELFQIAR